MRLFCMRDDHDHRFRLEISQAPDNKFLYSYSEFKVRPKEKDPDYSVQTLLSEDECDLEIIDSEEELGDFNDILELYNSKYLDLLRDTTTGYNLEDDKTVNEKLISILDDENYLRAVYVPDGSICIVGTPTYTTNPNFFYTNSTIGISGVMSFSEPTC